MSRKNQIIIFIIVAAACLVTIFTVKAPIRNYVPVVWGIYGFGLHLCLGGGTWIKLNYKLTRDYKSLLESEKITHYTMWGFPRIDNISLYRNKTILEKVDETTRKQILFFKTNFQLTFIAFFLFAIFGFLVVLRA